MLSKKKTVSRLLEHSSLESQKDFFKQYAILNSLLKKYPDENFWSVVSFNQKLKSLYFLKTKEGALILNKKYKEFKYKPKFTDSNLRLGDKFGKDIETKTKNKNLRNFLL